MEGLDPPLRAVAIADTGSQLLTYLIATAASDNSRVERQVLRKVTPQSGARASIFLAHATAATLARLASKPGHHLDPEVHKRTRDELKGVLPWPAEDQEVVAFAVNEIDPETATGLEESRGAVAGHALTLIIGKAEALALPALAEGDELDGYISGMLWDIAFQHGTNEYLDLVEPQT